MVEGSRRASFPAVLAIVGMAATVTASATAQGQSTPSPAELQALEQGVAGDGPQATDPQAEADPQATEADAREAGDSAEYEVIASSHGDAPLPELAEEEDEPFSDPDRVILGALAAEAMSGLAFVAGLVGCLFDDDDDPDDPFPDDMMMDPPPSRDQIRSCIFIAAGIGFSLGPMAGLAIIHNGDHFPGNLGLAFTGGLIGMGAALGLTLLTDVHDGVDAVYWLTLPVLTSVLFYELSGRIRRRRRAVETTVAPRIGRHHAGLGLQMRY